MSYKIEKALTKINFTDKNNTGRIKYIVIHYFGDFGTAKNVAQYFKNSYVGASAHYCIDEGETIYQCVEDADIAWHCGTLGAYVHKLCRNSNSLGIEVRPLKLNKKTKYASDKDWYFDDVTIDRLVEFTKDKMKEYGIPAENVIRHYDVTGKLCPRPYVGTDTNLFYNKAGNLMWSDFKRRISEVSEEDISNKEVVDASEIKIGDYVKLVNGARQSNGKAIASSYKSKVYKVTAKNGNVATLSIDNTPIYNVTVINLIKNGTVANPSIPSVPKSDSFRVRVTTDALNIRLGVGTACKVSGVIKDRGVYTITEVSEDGNWGKLKSGLGWIHLAYTTRV